MSVDGLPASTHAQAAKSDVKAPPAEGKDRGNKKTFDELLRAFEAQAIGHSRQLDRSAAPVREALPYEPTSRDMHYTSEVLVGDSAVSFASRPVVAPAASAPPVMLAQPFVSSGAPNSLTGLEEAFATPQVWRLEANIAAYPYLGQTDSLGIRTGSQVNGSIGRPLGMPPVIIARGGHVSNAFNPVWTHNSRAGQEASKPGPTRTAGPAPSAQPLHANTTIVAHLVADLAEYRIIIRGQRLSDGDRDQVIQDMSLALTELGLPLRPVRFVQSEQEG